MRMGEIDNAQPILIQNPRKGVEEIKSIGQCGQHFSSIGVGSDKLQADRYFRQIIVNWELRGIRCRPQIWK